MHYSRAGFSSSSHLVSFRDVLPTNGRAAALLGSLRLAVVQAQKQPCVDGVGSTPETRLPSSTWNCFPACFEELRNWFESQLISSYQDVHVL